MQKKYSLASLFGTAAIGFGILYAPLSLWGAEDHRQDMTSVLGSANPNPSIGEEAQTFDRLVGTWDADFTFHRDDGSISHKKGELFFGWTMDGRAIQDLWIGYPNGDKKERTIGTTLRFFDTALQQWRVVFLNPQFNYMVTMKGGREGDNIVLRGVDSDGLPIRWTFSEFTPDSFHWQGEKSHDGGTSWKVEEDHDMKRRLRKNADKGQEPQGRRAVSFSEP
jgi:hypothetical protein